MTKTFMVLLASAAAIASTAASAAVTVDYTTNAPLSAGSYATFNNRTLGSTNQNTGTGIAVSFTNGGAFVQGSVGGQYAAPNVTAANGAAFGQTAGTDATTYISTGTGTATLAFASPVSYFGLLWGSIDSFNSLTVNFSTGPSQTISGSAIAGFVDNSMSRYVNFTATPGSMITGFTATSSTNSFEFDNVAFGSAAPEAATWAMMMVGLGIAGGALRRRRVSTSVRFA